MSIGDQDDLARFRAAAKSLRRQARATLSYWSGGTSAPEAFDGIAQMLRDADTFDNEANTIAVELIENGNASDEKEGQ